MKGLQQFIGIFLFELFLSIRLSLTVYFFVIIITFGTKHATLEHGHCYKVASY